MKTVVHCTFGAVIAALFSLSAQAADSEGNNSDAQSDSGIHFVFDAGITFGGDKIATAEYTNGTSDSIRAGGLVQVGGGLIWDPKDLPVAVSLTVNYHVDDAPASNGSTTFSRVPVEAIVYYTGVDRWRFGAGARFVSSAKFHSHIDGESDDTINFKNTTGALVEVGYRVSSKWWVNGRVVSEKYKPTNVTYDGSSYDVSNASSLDGTHVGVNMLFEY